MLFSTSILGLVTFGLSALAQEKPVDEARHAALYANGLRHMEIRNKKEVRQTRIFMISETPANFGLLGNMGQPASGRSNGVCTIR